MRYSILLYIVSIISTPALADMTPEQKCEKQGEVAQEAARMRTSGLDKNTATTSLIKTYDKPGSGVTETNVRGLVMVSYMAKMEPEKMRDYAIDQCRKNIMK